MLIFAFSFAAQIPGLGPGFSPLLRGAGAWWGRPGRPPTCSRTPLAPAAATGRSGARVGGGAGRGGDAGPEGVAWHSEAKELRLAPIGSGAARGLNRATSAGLFSPNGWPAGLWRTGCCPLEMPQLSWCPTPAAGLGGAGSGQVPPAALRFPRGRRPRRHLDLRPARHAHLPFHPPGPSSPHRGAERRLGGAGAPRGGPRVRADLGFWLSRF